MKKYRNANDIDIVLKKKIKYNWPFMICKNVSISNRL